jgi:putative hemolysin
MKHFLEAMLLIILCLLAAFTAASEIALIAANRFKLRRMASDGSASAKLILHILEMPERFLGTILVANNVIETLIAAIVTAIVISIIGERSRSILLATLVAAFLIIVFEVAAKTLAARRAEKMSVVLAGPIQFLIFILSPIVRVLAIITNFIVNVVLGDSKTKAALVTEEEIKSLIKIGQEDGVFGGEKVKMLTKVFDFSNVIVKAVMTPKKDITAIDINTPLDSILDAVLESGYSRIPVYRDNPDNIIGIINMKDLLSLVSNKGLIVLQDIIFPATFVPSSRKVSELLREFQKGHTHLAIVIDSANKVEGIITLEDLLEEIVGEIEDEYDIRSKTAPKDKGSSRP